MWLDVVDNDVAAPHTTGCCVCIFLRSVFYLSYPDSPFPHNHFVLQPLGGTEIVEGTNVICMSDHVFIFFSLFLSSFSFESTLDTFLMQLEKHNSLGMIFFFKIDTYVCDKSS